jgi:hypothetical protein
MIEYIKKIISDIQVNSVKSYLVLANVVLVIFAIWFSNAGLLPFSNLGDFLFFAIFGLALAIYRPGWAFVLFVGSLVLENINLMPKGLGLALRPYQFISLVIIIALIIRFAGKRLPMPAEEFFPKFRWFDALPIIFSLGGFLSIWNSIDKGVSIKQSLIAFSFVIIYFLVRIYVQSLEDLKRIAPFFVSSAIIITLYGIWQNIAFVHEGNSFEIMPGRPNATFAEPDWLGIYIALLISVFFSLVYYAHKKYSYIPSLILNQGSISNDQIKKYLILAVLYGLITLSFITLILTVSRSAWLGTTLVTIGFLKIMLTNGSWKVSEWNWKKFIRSTGNIVAVIVISIGIIYIFSLTRFQIFSRAASVGGIQKITISCSQNHPPAPETVQSIYELQQYECRHINLEDIENEKALGNDVLEISRPDPNVNIRADIYRKSIEQIKQHPFGGIGWGNINNLLGKNTYGTGFNASDIFLEVWLGAGLLGILSFGILLLYIFIKSLVWFIDNKNEDKTIPTFVMLGWLALVIPNLFNSGIFLGFLWTYLAVAVSLLKTEKNIHL